jgi:hypothetical protein
MKKKLSRNERDSSSPDDSEAFELPTGCSALFSEQQVAAFLGACFRLGENAANCSGRFDSFYSSGG